MHPGGVAENVVGHSKAAGPKATPAKPKPPAPTFDEPPSSMRTPMVPFELPSQPNAQSALHPPARELVTTTGQNLDEVMGTTQETTTQPPGTEVTPKEEPKEEPQEEPVVPQMCPAPFDDWQEPTEEERLAQQNAFWKHTELMDNALKEIRELRPKSEESEEVVLSTDVVMEPGVASQGPAEIPVPMDEDDSVNLVSMD